MAVRQIEVGDRVLILHKASKGQTGRVLQTGIRLPHVGIERGVKVRRDDSSGIGIYDERDLRVTEPAD